MLDVEAGTSARAGHPLELTAIKLRLLVYLAEQRGRVVSKEQILAAVWGYNASDPNPQHSTQCCSREI
jgi:DNA-binding response OmpR family regulator